MTLIKFGAATGVTPYMYVMEEEGDQSCRSSYTPVLYPAYSTLAYITVTLSGAQTQEQYN